MKILIVDFEVFKYDTLLGVYDVNDDRYYQTWNFGEMKEYYYRNQNAIWIGHNNADYDNNILSAIVRGKDPYEVSQDIIVNKRRHFPDIKLNYYDLMQLHPTSLKVMEAALGKNISESSVDFRISRPLTSEEKLEVESYNRDDLDQTFLDLKLSKSEFQLKMDLIREFKLPIDALHYTQAQIAEAALGAIKDDTLVDKPVHPILYPQLKVKNKEALDFYLNEGFKIGEKPIINLCGLDHQMGAGGMHAGEENTYCDWALYLDVSGYYNLVMILYNLLSRAIPEEGKELYKYMYHQQLALKGVDDVKRAVYKTILLAVFGAQMHKGSKLYDPWNGALVPVVGQMFLIDLLEKLEGKVRLVQSNTDGIMVKPLGDEKEVLAIVEEWCTRTGFTIKPKKIYDIYQRDVNNYMYRDDKGKIHTKGEAVGYYECWENPLENNSYNSKEPIIIHYCIVEYLMNGIKPEQTIVKYAKEFRMFQWICKLNSFDYLTFEANGERQVLQKVNRCFASKVPGMIYKNKASKHDRYSNLADRVFVFNNSLDKLNYKDIDYVYYAHRAYERINDFKPC